MSQNEKHFKETETSTAKHFQWSAAANNDLIVTPSETSAEKDFDFHTGNWRINNKIRKKRLKNSDEWTEFTSRCESWKILNGFGNVNQYRFEKGGDNVLFQEGLVLRLFNPPAKLWTVYWANSREVTLDVPVVGSFKNKIGTFFSKDASENVSIIVRCVYDATSAPERIVWSQAFSADAGKTFETNWIMDARRQS